MRVPTLKMQISAKKHWILHIYEIQRGKKHHYTQDEPSFSHIQKKGKLTGLSLHIFLQNLSYTELSSKVRGNYSPMYLWTVTDHQRIVKHNRSCKRNEECHFLSLNYNTLQLMLLVECSDALNNILEHLNINRFTKIK